MYMHRIGNRDWPQPAKNQVHHQITQQDTQHPIECDTHIGTWPKTLQHGKQEGQPNLYASIRDTFAAT